MILEKRFVRHKRPESRNERDSRHRDRPGEFHNLCRTGTAARPYTRHLRSSFYAYSVRAEYDFTVARLYGYFPHASAAYRNARTLVVVVCVVFFFFHFYSLLSSQNNSAPPPLLRVSGDDRPRRRRD